MRLLKVLSCGLLFLLIPVCAFPADRITMEDGRVYEGEILFWTGAQYVLSVDGQAEWLDISDIREIDFGPTGPRDNRFIQKSEVKSAEGA